MTNRDNAIEAMAVDYERLATQLREVEGYLPEGSDTRKEVAMVADRTEEVSTRLRTILEMPDDLPRRDASAKSLGNHGSKADYLSAAKAAFLADPHGGDASSFADLYDYSERDFAHGFNYGWQAHDDHR